MARRDPRIFQSLVLWKGGREGGEEGERGRSWAAPSSSPSADLPDQSYQEERVRGKEGEGEERRKGGRRKGGRDRIAADAVHLALCFYRSHRSKHLFILEEKRGERKEERRRGRGRKEREGGNDPPTYRVARVCWRPEEKEGAQKKGGRGEEGGDREVGSDTAPLVRKVCHHFDSGEKKMKGKEEEGKREEAPQESRNKKKQEK